MSSKAIRIGVVAPGTRIEPELAEKVRALALAAYPELTPEIVFHPQCYLSSGHFAGDDNARAQAFLTVANDPSFDALWFARGGYGANRIAEAVLPHLKDTARAKTYLGYSDAGFLLAGLYRAGFENIAHGPMPVDLTRDGGAHAVKRGLSWLVDRAPEALELTASPDVKTAAFNIMILSNLLGTHLQPDLSDHVLMLEEIGEYMYRIDRSLFHITSNPGIRKVAGIKLGRCSVVPRNEPDFVLDEEQVARFWCARAGIAYLGRADIGHDVDNRIVPFGAL